MFCHRHTGRGDKAETNVAASIFRWHIPSEEYKNTRYPNVTPLTGASTNVPPLSSSSGASLMVKSSLRFRFTRM